MKGLLLEIYYKNIKSICIMNGLLVFVWILVRFLIDTQMVAFIYFAVVIFLNSLLLLLSQRKDYDLKLYKYEFMLPVKKKYIVLSKYISQVCSICLALVILTVINYITVSFGRNYFDYGITDFVILMNVLLAFIFQMISIINIGLYFLDLEKGDLWIVLGLMGSVALVAMEMVVLNRLMVSKTIGNFVFLGIYLLIFILSYFLCAKRIENLKFD